MIAARQPAEPALAPASRPTVRFLDPLAVDGWDREVSQFEGATTFHSAPWCSVLKDTYGFRPWYAVCELDGVIRGVLPLMEVNNFPKGRRGISLPFTDECCALSKDGQIREQLTAALMDEGKRRQWKYVEVRGTQILDGTASLSFYTHRLDLQAGQKVLERFDSSVQRAIRKAEKSGVVVEIAHGLDAVRSFYELHQGTRQKHGGPPQPFTFFANIHRHIIEKGHGFVALARTGDRVIAAAVFFCFGKKAIYKFGASDEQFQQLRANNLIFWKAIQMLAGNGVVELDFGRTSLENEGLRRFKLGWGTVESRIDYFKYDFKGKCFATESDAASGWHTRFFRMMPRPISRWAGAMLYNRTA